MFQQEISVGQYLQRERENKKLTLQEISKNTCIKSAFLQALEQDAFQILPCETYARGFIRSYSAYLGLNCEKVLEMYRCQVNPVQSEVLEKPKKSDPLKTIKNHLFDFLATIAGGPPSYSVDKSFLRPKH